MPKTDEYGQIVDGFQGSLIVAQFESLDAARQWAQVDPYQGEGVYMESNVYPYKKAF